MRFLDIIVSPFGSGGPSIAVFCVGAGLFAAICGFTVVVLVRQFQKENARREKRRDKVSGDSEE